MNPEFEVIATGREGSLFQNDIEKNKKALLEKVKGSRIAIIGAAGSIGASVLREVLNFQPSSLVLFDLSENNLVEIVRELRSTPDIQLPQDFSTMAIGLGSEEFSAYFKESPPFDYILNLAAVKHVRSEKNVYSINRLINTNIRYLYHFLNELPYDLKGFFSVSSDKAVGPANLMGASKNAMEQACFYFSKRHNCTSARFANVAFSDGSLLFSFIKRVEKRQCLSAPNDVKRYFISHQEAGQLCVLAAFLGKPNDVFIPKLENDLNEKTFSSIALDFLDKNKLEGKLYNDEASARRAFNEGVPADKWPCYFSGSDTSGEKPYEEFVGQKEEVNSSLFEKIGVISRILEKDEEKALINFLSKTENLFENGLSKADVVELFKTIVPDLKHVESGKNLDQKM